MIDRQLSIKTDHMSILNFDLNTSTDILFNLGFVRGGGRSALDQRVMGMTVPSVRFVFDNAYLECVQFPPEVSEFYNYLHTPAGIHLIALLTPDAERCRERFCANGVEVDELEQIVRKNTDYGELQGPLVFRMVPIPHEIIPRTNVAFLQHCTRDLMYQPTRYAQPNGVVTIEEIVICCWTRDEADRAVTELTELRELSDNEKCEGGIGLMRFMDPETICERYGIGMNPKGSPFAVLRFKTMDMDKTMEYIKAAGYPYRRRKDAVQVVLPERFGMVFEFIR